MRSRLASVGPAVLVMLAVLVTAACEDDARRRVSGMADGARCMADGASGALSGDRLDEVRDAGTDVAQVGAELANKAVELRDALDDCVDVRATLVQGLRDAGLDETKATCVADRALEDDKILGPLLVNLAFGDPGIGTAVAIAVRAGGPCLTPEERDRLIPG